MSQRILLIDPDPESSAHLQTSMHEVGLEVTATSSGAEGLDSLALVRPAVTVIDSVPHDLPWPELCRQLRQSPVGQNTAIVVLAENEPGAAVSMPGASEGGCDVYIEKPVEDARLLQVCLQLLATQPEEEPPAIADALLDSEELTDVLDRLESIVDEPPQPAQAAAHPGLADGLGEPEQTAQAATGPSLAEGLAELAGTPDSSTDPAARNRDPRASLKETLAELTRDDGSMTDLDDLEQLGGPLGMQASELDPDAMPSPETESAVKWVPEPPDRWAPEPRADEIAEPATESVSEPADEAVIEQATQQATEPVVSQIAEAGVAAAAADIESHLDSLFGGESPAPKVSAEATVAPETAQAAEATLAAEAAPTTEPEPDTEAALAPLLHPSLVGIDGGAIEIVDEEAPNLSSGLANPGTPMAPPRRQGGKRWKLLAALVVLAGAVAAISFIPISRQFTAMSNLAEPIERAPLNRAGELFAVANAPRIVEETPTPEPAVAQPDATTAAATPTPIPVRESTPPPAATEPSAEPPSPFAHRETAVEASPQEEPTAEPTATAEITPTPEPTGGAAKAVGYAPPFALTRVEPKFAAGDVPEGGYVVLLNVMVTKRGKVIRVSVEEGNPQSQLVAAAIDAVLRTKYRPATQDGELIKAWTLERFEYPVSVELE